METSSVVLTFEYLNEIPWCDHSNKTSFPVLLHGSTCFSIIIYKKKFKILYEFNSYELKGKMLSLHYWQRKNISRKVHVMETRNMTSLIRDKA